MIPIMAPDASQKDKRKGKTLSWREAKISLAHAKGSRTPIYGGAIEGGVETAGRRLFACAVRAGFGAISAGSRGGGRRGRGSWARSKQFGPQGSYLIDFYHVCEYLSAAAKTIAPDAAAERGLDGGAKGRAEDGAFGEDLQALAPHLEPPLLDDDQAPVRTVPSLSERSEKPTQIS